MKAIETRQMITMCSMMLEKTATIDEMAKCWSDTKTNLLDKANPSQILSLIVKFGTSDFTDVLLDYRGWAIIRNIDNRCIEGLVADGQYYK